jgi:hypothetical protein
MRIEHHLPILLLALLVSYSSNTLLFPVSNSRGSIYSTTVNGCWLMSQSYVPVAPGEFLQYWHDGTTPATIGRRKGNRGGFSANTARHSKIQREFRLGSLRASKNR